MKGKPLSSLNSALFMLAGLYSEFSFTKTMPSFMDERSGVCQNGVI